jgi:glycolate oxidase
MAISKEAYRALEDIVGPENITDEPATLDSYAYQLWAEFRRDGSKFMPRAGAVVLPGSTEEVQAIVRTCNQYKLKYKAHSTGWALFGAPLVEGAIQLDMRRMDRILEIDKRNMFAVIEPYVIGATLQAEAMKLGLNTHITGAGASCSPLAAATSFQGAGPDSIFMGAGPENLLAAEWVMPTGDILKTGSLGSGLGWFCGDGPGPSLRGVFKGALGAAGGLGIFTKCAVKLYPWPGPAVMPIEGKVPVYTTSLPENIRCHTIAWSTWQGYTDALYKIFDNDIGYIAHRQFIMFGEELQAAVLKIVTDATKTMNDLEELLKMPEVQKLTEEMRRSFQIVLAGMTPRDIQHQEMILDQILAETGGWKVAAMEEPTMAGWSLLYLIKLCFKNLNCVYAGGFYDAMLRGGVPDLVASGWMEMMREQKRKFGQQGGIVDDGGDAGMGGMGSMGGGGYPGFENFILYDPSDTESVEAARACYADAGHRAIEIGLGGYSIFFIEKEQAQAQLAGMVHPAIFRYQRKIKEALDPNEVGDGSWFYLDEHEIEAGSKRDKSAQPRR